MDTVPTTRLFLRGLAQWRRIAILLALAAMSAASLWHLHILNRQMPSSHSDLVPVWVGVQTILHGHDPYSDQTTLDIQTVYYGRHLVETDHVNKMGFAYPLYTAIVLAPIALLSWEHLRLAFLTLVPFVLAISVSLWLRVLNLRYSSSHRMIATVLVLTSWPVMWGVRLQQATLIVMIFLAVGCFLLVRHWDVGAAMFLSLTTIKPQLVGLTLLWFLLWAILQRRWRFVLSFAAAMSVLLFGSFWMDLAWLPHWWSAMKDYAQYTGGHPALQRMFGAWLGTFLMIAIAVVSSAILWRFRGCDMESTEFAIAISLSLAITLALLPTFLAMIYNQILLLPSLLLLANIRPGDYYAALARKVALMSLGWGYVATLVAIFAEEAGQPSNFADSIPFQNYLLPALTVVALIAVSDPRRALSMRPEVSPTELSTPSAALS